MKRHWLLTALGAILAGAGLHFLWQALPNPLFALISPVNESVWEHLKLLYWPMLGAALVLAEEGLDGKKLFAAAAGLLRDDARMARMADSMAQLGIRDATERIYRTVMALVK